MKVLKPYKHYNRYKVLQFYVTTKAENMSEKFSLKWNDFKSNVSKSFRLFRNEEYLHDVTLVSDDQHQVTAHKLVLSASSDYFKTIFKNNKHSTTLLCLDGISSIDLSNILDYIYNGEVQIYQENIDRFLTVAQRFKIEGLLGDENEEEKEEEKVIPNFSSPVVTRTPKRTKTEQNHIIENTSIQLNDQKYTTDLFELDQKLYEHMEQISNEPNNLLFSCKFCSKTAKQRQDMKFHVETHIGGLSFPCDTCGKEFRSRVGLRVHKKIHKKHNEM